MITVVTQAKYDSADSEWTFTVRRFPNGTFLSWNVDRPLSEDTPQDIRNALLLWAGNEEDTAVQTKEGRHANTAATTATEQIDI